MKSVFLCLRLPYEVSFRFPQSVLCCFVSVMSDMVALLWRSQRGQWGNDRFTHYHDDHYHLTKHVNAVKLEKTFKCTKMFFFNIALCLCVSPLSVSFFYSDSSLFTPKLPNLETPSVKIKSFSHTINIQKRKLICWISFSLTAHSHLKWSQPHWLPVIISALFLSRDWLLRLWPQGVTYGALGSPFAGLMLAPGHC